MRPIQKWDWSDFQFPRKNPTSYKGDHGKLGVIGGSPERPGAAMLAAEAGARVGAGYSTLFFARPGKNFRISVSEASFLFRPKWKISDLKDQSALVVGCGFSPPPFFDYQKLSMPMVIDASALSDAKAKHVNAWRKMKASALLTPHYGEAAALLKTSTTKVMRDPQAAVDELVEMSGQSVYLKGSPAYLRWGKSLGKQPANLHYVNSFAQPAFATAGSGDVLAGIIGGFLARAPREFKSDHFKRAVTAGIIFQRAMAKVLGDIEGAIASDQLRIFSKTFQFLRARQ